jgi:hypothetical protein
MAVRSGSARRPLRRVAGTNAETRIWGTEAGVGRPGGGAVVFKNDRAFLRAIGSAVGSRARSDPRGWCGKECRVGGGAERGTARGRRWTKFE